MSKSVRLAMRKQWTVDVIPHVKAVGASLEERFHKPQAQPIIQDLYAPLVAATRSSRPKFSTATMN